MKSQQDKQIISLDRFDETVSLWQLIPAGTGKGLKHLRTITDAILNSQIERTRKPLSVLITGKQGARTHARAFLRALGMENVDCMPARLLQVPNSIHELFDPSRYSDSCIIGNAELLYPVHFKVLFEAIANGEFSSYNSYKKITEYVPMNKAVALTAHDEKLIPEYLKEKVDHIVRLEEYTDQQLELIVLQRLKYCNVEYESDGLLSQVVEYGQSDLRQIGRMLKDAITVMLADDRRVLTVADLQMLSSNEKKQIYR